MVLLVASVSPGLAQGPSRTAFDFAAVRATKSVEAIRITEPIAVDGRLDEPAWVRAPTASDFYQQEPSEGAPATERSEVLFLYDEDFLYVGGRFYDSDPRGGITNELKRDFAARDGDTVAVLLDPFRHDSSFNFHVNPAGALRDSQNYDDGRQTNANWDAVWWAKTARFEGGWTMEMKVPFKSLRFPKESEQEWGLNVFRLVRRKNEIMYWAPQPRQFGPYKPSYYGRLTGLRDVHPGRNLYVKPFVTAAGSNRRLTGLTRQWDADGGLDAKYGVTSSLALDLTYRTDFSQVEVDEQQVNLTRFSLFFPEKREFFLENQGAFRIGDQDSSGQLSGGQTTAGRRDLVPFFSRRIGMSATGQPIPILGGARLTGPEKGYTLGLLNLQTDGTDGQPADNFTTIRLNRAIGASSFGGFYLGREGSGAGGFNRVGGGEVHLNYRRSIDINGLLMASTSSSGSGQAGRAAFSVSESSYRALLAYTNISPRFRDDLGFIPRGDIGLVAWDAALLLRPKGPHRRFRSISLGTLGEAFENSGHDTLTSRRLRGYSVQQFSAGGDIEVDLDWNYEVLSKPFEVSSGIVISPGRYRFGQFLATLSTNKSRALSLTAGYTGGEFYSGTLQGFSSGARWRLNEKLASSANYTFNAVDLPQGRFNTDLARFRVDYSFSTRMFLNAFVQYNSASRTWLTNVRYRLIYRPLSDLYLVYNDTHTAGRPPQRTIAVKHTMLLAF